MEHVTISRSSDEKIKIKVKKRFKITKEKSEDDEIRSRTNNTTVKRTKRDRAKTQTMFDKILHRKLKIE